MNILTFLRLSLVISLILGGNFSAYSQDCNPDTQGPTVACKNISTYVVMVGEETIIPAGFVVDAVFDNCTAPEDIQFFISTDPFQTTPSTATSLSFPAGTIGDYPVKVWAMDEAGLYASCWGTLSLLDWQSNCENDIIAPIAVCDIAIELQASTEEQIIQATALDNGSYDFCTTTENLSFFATLDLQDPSIPNTTFITIPADTNGVFAAALWVIDEAGNANHCLVNINVNGSAAECENDTTAPVAVCEIAIELQASTEEQIIQATAIDNGSYDLCTTTENLSFFATLDWQDTAIPNTTFITIPADTSGVFTAALWVIDEAGNANHCFVNINVNGSPADCENDVLAPIVICHSLDVQLMPDQSISISAQNFNADSWDNCTALEDLQFYISTDLNLTSPPATDSIFIPANSDSTFIVSLWVVDEAGLYASCETYIIVQQVLLPFGKIFNDENQNCLFEETESGIDNYAIRYTIDQGQNYYTELTDSDGNYWLPHFLTQINIPGLPNPENYTEISLELLLPPGMSSNCATSVTVPLPLEQDLDALKFALELASDCNSMLVDIAAPFLRRCFPTTYTTTYCNSSVHDIDNVEIVVTLPPEMVIESVGVPYTNLGNNQLLIELGTVLSGTCAQFPIKVILDCDTPLGATKCVQAAISPNDCQEPDPNWSGAHLVVTGECDEATNEVKFKIENIGTGTMQEAKPAIVIEDVIMYQYAPIQLGPGEFEELSFAANGSTWRVQIPQEFGHPSLSDPMAVIEGCVEYGSMGYINQFPMPDLDPYIAIDCQEVIGSFDPNDKSAFPHGYDAEHIVEANTSLEYKIRFQNTGTDTAFTVRLEDKLSEYLDYSTIVPGTSSHPYRMELHPDSILIFHFENINLPDSTTDESGSHGFVQFRVNQIPDNPSGTVIENQANIYFDFNEPILTNTVFHTIGSPSIINSSSTLFDPGLDIAILPNPFDQITQFSLTGWQGQQGKIELFDALGQLIRVEYFSEKEFEFHRKDLAVGAYFYRLSSGQNVLATGKLLMK